MGTFKTINKRKIKYITKSHCSKTQITHNNY